MAKTYREVLERYDRARAFGEKRSLSEYSAHLNDIYQTQDFSEGLRDGPWTRFSTRADQVLGDTLGQVTGPLGEAFGGVFGAAEAGRRVGEGLPRALIQTAPLYLAGPEAGLPATAAALGATGALFGGQTYADTGSVKAAALSAATAAAMPAVGKYGGQLGAKVFGAPRIAGESVANGKYINEIIPTTAAQRGAMFGGSQLAQSVVQEASGYAQHKTLDPDTPYDWLSPDFLIGQIPFTVYDAVNMTKAPKVTLEQAKGLVKPKTVAPVPEPFKRSVEPSVEESLTTEAAMSAYRSIAQDESVPVAEKQAKLAAVLASIQAPGTVKAVKEVQTAATRSLPDPDVMIAGKAEPVGPGVWRVRVDEQPEVPGVQNLTGKTVFVNGAEPTVDTPNGKVFRVKASQVKPAKFAIPPEPVPDPNQPSLPVQERPGALPKTKGIGGGEMERAPYPEMEGQPIDTSPQEISPTEAQGLVQMGVKPETVEKVLPRSKRFKGALFLGEGVQKSKNAVLGMFQGKIMKDAEGKVRVLGGRDIPVAPMPEREFVKRTQVSPTLLPLFRQHYPEAFDAAGNVDPSMLMKGLEERPLVETVKGFDVMSGVRRSGDALHDLENLGYTVNAGDVLEGVRRMRGQGDLLGTIKEGTPEFLALPQKVQQFYEEYKKAPAVTNVSYSPHYSISSSPRGGTEIAVVAKGAQGEALPSDAHHDVPGLLGTATVEEKTLGEIRATMGKEHPKLQRFASLPDESVVGVQSEAQSDWEGEVRDAAAKYHTIKQIGPNNWAIYNEEGGLTSSGYPTEQVAKDTLGASPPSHPLLPYWERLVADAVIQHGIDRGWVGVVVTDAKTAAMTEGHDAVTQSAVDRMPYQAINQTTGEVKTFNTLDKANYFVAEEARRPDRKLDQKWLVQETPKPSVADITQFPGHAQHYGDPDFRIGPEETPGSLQQEFAKATGEENTLRKGGGNVLAVGVHKGAREASSATPRRFDTYEEALAYAGEEGQVDTLENGFQGTKPTTELKGSPSLTEPHPVTGIVGPKVYATGNFYSFDKIKGGLSLDDTRNLKEAVMKYEQAKVREESARANGTKVPETAEEWVELTAYRGDVERNRALGLDPDIESGVPALFLTDSQINARNYATEPETKAVGEVREVALRPKNPLIVDAQGKAWNEVQDLKAAKAAGHDVVVYKNVGDNADPMDESLTTTYVVLDKAAIVKAREVQVKETVERELSRGATPTQAAETARLLTQTPDLEAALKELEIHAEEARTIAEKVDMSILEASAKRLEETKARYVQLRDNPPDEKALQSVKDAYEAEFVTAANAYEAARKAAAKSTTGIARAGDEVVKAEGEGGTEQHKYSPGLEDEFGGRRMFRKEADAQKFIDTYEGLDKGNLRVRDGGKNADGSHKGYYIAAIENLRTSYEGPTSEEGSTLQNVLSQDTFREPGQSEIGSTSLPRSAVDGMLETMEVLERSPGTLNRMLRENNLTPEDWAKVKEAWTEDDYDGTEVSHMKAANLILPFQRKPAPYMLGSTIPFDEALVEQTGVRRGGRAVVEWLSAQQDLGLVAELVGKWKNFPDELNAIEIVTQGDPRWEPQYSFQQEDVINLDYLPTSETRKEWARGVAHEIAHFMERRLSSRNDPAAVEYRKARTEILKTLRESKQLPQKVRNLLAKALKQNDYDRYRKGEDVFSEWQKVLGTKDFEAYYEILYGLSDEFEMVAQAFSSPKFQGLMANEPAQKKGFAKVLNWFSDVYNKLVGGDPTSSNALAELLASHDDYLSGGLLRGIYNGKDFIRDSLIRVQGVRPEALASRMKTVERTFAKGDLYGSIAGFEREGENGLLPTTAQFPERPLSPAIKSPDGQIVKGGIHAIAHNKVGETEGWIEGFETTRGRFVTREEAAQMGGRVGKLDSNDLSAITRPIDQPLRTALVSGDTKSVFQGTMNLLPDQLPVHQELFYRMQQDVALTKELVKQVKEGKIQAVLPPNTEANLKLAGVKLNAMRRALKKQGLALERQADLANFTYDGLDSIIADQLIRPELPDPESQPPEMEQAQALMGMRRMAPPRSVGDVKTETSGRELAGEGLGWFEKNFAMTQFFKKENPDVRAVVGHVQDEHGKATQTATELNLVLNGRMDPATGKWEVSQPVRKALEKVAGSPTLTSAFSDAIRLTAERAKQNRTWSWSDPEFAAILRPLNPTDRDAVRMVQTQFKLRHDHFVNSVVPEKFSELNHENTATVIQTLEGNMLPEQAREIATKVYNGLQAMMDPARLPLGTALLQDVQRTLSPATFLKALEHANQSIADVNGFIDVARKNLDFVSEQRFDAHHLRMTGPKGEKHYSSAKTMEELQKRRVTLEGKGYKFEYYTPKADANSTVGGVNAEIMGKFREMDTLAIQRLTSALSGRPDTAQLLETVLPEVRRAEEYAASSQAFRPVPGVTRNLVGGREYLNMIDNAHEFYGRGINWFKHKITRAKTNLDMMHPEIAGNRVLKDWSEQHVKNYLTQDSDVVRKFNEFVFYQRLALNTGNMLLESVQSLGTGMQALIAETGSVTDAFKLTASATKEYIQFLKTKKGSTPELEYLLKKAEATGAAEPTLWDDTYDPNTNSLMSVSAKPGSPVKKGLNIMGALARKPSSALQKMNNNIALIASFKLGMEQGMTRDEAFNFARDVKERGTFTGGKPQRSVGLWGIKSRPVPQLMTSLTTYVQGWFNQMAQDYKIGFKGAGSDLTAQQRQGSRKAFVYGLAAQAVLAGGLGLPGVGQGIALLNQVTGLDLKGWLRQNLAKLFDEDQDSGGLLTNLALRGAAQAVSPIDPSNRAAIAVPFVGVDPYKGFSVAALAGAPGSSVEDFVKGLFALAQGDQVGYQKLLPSVLKGPAGIAQAEGVGNLLNNEPGSVRDNRGGLLQVLTPAEKWMTALGLPSSRIQRARDTADTLKKQAEGAQRQKEALVDSLAKLYRAGQTTEVQRRMISLRQADPSLDLKDLAQSIAKRVQAQTIPYDIRRDMNVGADIAGLQSRLPSTESLRRQVSYDVESSLGFAPSFNPQMDAQAMAVDRLLDSNPFLTRAEALRSVRGTRRVRRPIDPAWMQAFQ